MRELQNAIEYSANLCEEKELTPDALPEYLTCPAQELPCKTPAPPREEDQIKALLTKYGYTLEGKKMIAKQLGISLRTLYRKLDQYQLSGKN